MRWILTLKRKVYLRGSIAAVQTHLAGLVVKAVRNRHTQDREETRTIVRQVRLTPKPLMRMTFSVVLVYITP